MKIIVGSRGSKLALVQTNWVVDRMKAKDPDIDFEVKIIKTKGDKIQHKALDKIGDKGLFVKEIEEQLLSGQIDLAVHSMKDMPSILPDGLKLSYTPIREDYRDVLVLKKGYKSIDDLPKGAIIGTGSKRRKHQILMIRNDLNIVPIRGNVETRIRKIDDENLDGTILAAAGIKRLGLDEILGDRIFYLDENMMLPAPAQGILAIEIKEGREEVEALLEDICDQDTMIQSIAERAFLGGVNGSCHIPIGSLCKVKSDGIELYGFLGNDDGSKLIKKSLKGSAECAKELGTRLANDIVKELSEL